jgi:hypothetical protein
MNRSERIEELASRYVLGTLGDGELEELDAILRASEEARSLFAELCADEMLLWQHLNLDAAPPDLSKTASFAPAVKRRPSFHSLGRVAALFMAFISGWAFSVAWPARDAFLADVEPGSASAVPALKIVYPPPLAQQGTAVVFPLDFDESGRPTLQSIRTTDPLEIATL